MDKSILELKLKQLHDEIKMFEKERIENDITNVNKLQPLYELYHKLKNRIEGM